MPSLIIVIELEQLPNVTAVKCWFVAPVSHYQMVQMCGCVLLQCQHSPPGRLCIAREGKTKMLEYFHNPVNIYFVLQFNLDTFLGVPISSSHSQNASLSSYTREGFVAPYQLLTSRALFLDICKISRTFAH